MTRWLQMKDIPRSTTRAQYRSIDSWLRKTQRILDQSMQHQIANLMIYGCNPLINEATEHAIPGKWSYVSDGFWSQV